MQTMTSTARQAEPVTVIVPHFAREIRTDRDRYRTTDTAAKVTSHFLLAASARAARLDEADARIHRVRCGGGYRVIRKRVAD